jgi:uncharacterized membrane protein YgaE (UPF0421/DUF939 family)
MVLLSLIVGGLLGIGKLGTPQIAISGLMVWSMGHHRELGYASLRFLETLVGAAVAVLVNGLINPVDFSRSAAVQAGALANELAGLARGVVHALKESGSDEGGQLLDIGRAVEPKLEKVKASLVQARESLRWNVFAQGRRRGLDRLERAVTLLERNANQLRTMARILSEADLPAGSDERRVLVEMVSAAAAGLDLLADGMGRLDDPSSERGMDPLSPGRRSIQQYERTTGARMDTNRVHLWALVSTAMRLIEDEDEFFSRGRVNQEWLE